MPDKCENCLPTAGKGQDGDSWKEEVSIWSQPSHSMQKCLFCRREPKSQVKAGSVKTVVGGAGYTNV